MQNENRQQPLSNTIDMIKLSGNYKAKVKDGHSCPNAPSVNSSPGQFRLNPRRVIYHLDRIQSNLRGFITPPLSLEIHPTLACNLDCEYCYYVAARKTPLFIPFPRLLQLIDEISNLGIKTITLSGGGAASTKINAQVDSNGNLTGTVRFTLSGTDYASNWQGKITTSGNSLSIQGTWTSDHGSGTFSGTGTSSK